jgi:hypothetical protein
VGIGEEITGTTQCIDKGQNDRTHEPQPNTSSQRTLEIHRRDNQVQLPTDYNIEHQLCQQQEPLDHEGRIQSANHSQLLGESGKRAGVISIELEVTLTTQPHSNQNEGGVLGCEEASSRDEVKPSNNTYTLDTHILLACPESIIMGLYCLGSEDKQWNSVPFVHTIKLNGLKGEVIRLTSTFDNGAMASTVDLKMFQNVKHHLNPLQKSNCILHIADG